MKKITKEQLEKLQGIVNDVNAATIEIGKLEGAKHKMLHALNNSEQALSELQKELQEEYGDKIVDIKTGELKENESGKED